MARPNKSVPLAVIVWANIVKWATIRGVEDRELAACLGLKELAPRKRNHYITVDEMARLCGLLAVEPEKLLER